MTGENYRSGRKKSQSHLYESELGFFPTKIGNKGKKSQPFILNTVHTVLRT